jgi:hypothetical protein
LSAHTVIWLAKLLHHPTSARVVLKLVAAMAPVLNCSEFERRLQHRRHQPLFHCRFATQPEHYECIRSASAFHTEAALPST